MDTGFITLKQPDLERGLDQYRQNSLLPGQPKFEVAPMFEMSDAVVVEWRALTVAYLDIVAERVRETLNLDRKRLNLSQLIQGGTWSVSIVVHIFLLRGLTQSDDKTRLVASWPRSLDQTHRNLLLL